MAVIRYKANLTIHPKKLTQTTRRLPA